MTFVLDVSVTIPWCFGDEWSPLANAVLNRLETEPAIVPGIWSLELANVLLIGERRNRTTQNGIADFLNRLRALPIRVDAETDAFALNNTLGLARQYNLSSYDASYLELAMRLGIPLATQDNRLVEAGRSAGVSIVT
jgi:predicted nucleic acid-binding protein